MPHPSCPYPESRKFGENYDYQRLLQFLMGLNDSYSPPKSQIFMMSLLPTLNKTYVFLLDQESQRNLVHSVYPSVGLSPIVGSTM